MTYKIDIKNWGRVFTVPCSVVDNYLKDTDGDFLKILLCVISFGNCEIDSKKICELCNVSELCVKNAIDYWNKCGVISSETDNDFIGFTPAENKPVIKENTLLVDKSDADRTNNNYYSSSQISEIINNNEELKFFFQEIQKVLGRVTNNTEQRGFIYIYEELGYSPSSIILITEYCKNLGKTSIAYIKSVANNWFSQDIIGYDDVEKHIIKMNEYHSYENTIKRTLDIELKLSSKQSEYIKNWKNWDISPDLVLHAYDITVENTNKMSFAYMNKIIEKWHESGVKTVEQAKMKVSEPKNNKENKNHSYDIEEINDFQMNFLMNRKKKKMR